MDMCLTYIGTSRVFRMILSELFKYLHIIGLLLNVYLSFINQKQLWAQLYAFSYSQKITWFTWHIQQFKLFWPRHDYQQLSLVNPVIPQPTKTYTKVIWTKSCSIQSSTSYFTVSIAGWQWCLHQPMCTSEVTSLCPRTESCGQGIEGAYI